MRRKLTKLTVEKLKPPKAGKRLEIWDTVVPGFGLRITDNDVRSFFVMYRHGRGAVVHDKEGRIIAGLAACCGAGSGGRWPRLPSRCCRAGRSL